VCEKGETKAKFFKSKRGDIKLLEVKYMREKKPLSSLFCGVLGGGRERGEKDSHKEVSPGGCLCGGINDD